MYLRTLLFHEQLTWQGDVFAVLMIALGATLFSSWVFGIINNREIEIRQRTEQLAALHDAALALTTELDLGLVLQKVVDLSRALVNAKYGALGVLEDNGEYIEQFITSGITPEQRALLGEPPRRGSALMSSLIVSSRACGRSTVTCSPTPNHLTECSVWSAR